MREQVWCVHAWVLMGESKPSKEAMLYKNGACIRDWFPPGDTLRHATDGYVILRRSIALSSAAALAFLATSCAEVRDALVDSIFDSIGESLFESSYDSKIDFDTERMRDGKPLQHSPSERRLRLAREDRIIDEMMDD